MSDVVGICRSFFHFKKSKKKKKKLTHIQGIFQLWQIYLLDLSYTDKLGTVLKLKLLWKSIIITLSSRIQKKICFSYFLFKSSPIDQFSSHPSVSQRSRCILTSVRDDIQPVLFYKSPYCFLNITENSLIIQI